MFNIKFVLMKFEKERNILWRINKVKNLLNRMIIENEDNRLDEDILEISKYLDDQIVLYMKGQGAEPQVELKGNIKEIENDDKQLQMSILRKEYSYRILFENHNSVILLINPDSGNIIDANKAAINYYGYTKEQLLSMRIMDINTLDEEEIKNEMDLAKTEKRNYFQFVHRLSNNELREVEVHSFRIKIGDTNLLFSSIYDISDKIHQQLMYNTLFFDSPYAVVILDNDQKIVNVNKHFTELFQYTINEIKGQGIHILSSDINISQINDNVNFLYEGKIIKQEGLRKRKDGEKVCVEILGYPVINHQEVMGVYALYIDISERKRYEEQLLLFQKVLENNMEGVIITDAQGVILWINNAFNRITGYSDDELIGHASELFDLDFTTISFYKNMKEQLLLNEHWCGEVWSINKKQNLFSGWLVVNNIKNTAGEVTHYVGLLQDLSEKKKNDKKVRELQQRDLLTGLYNRSFFTQILDKMINEITNEKKNFALLMIDIEGLKDINNSVGYNIGDKLLVKISKILISLVKDECFISRFSEDEFALIHYYTNKYELNRYIRIIFEQLRKPFVIENTVIYVNINIGISCCPDNKISAEALIQQGDIAVYKARENVGDKYCFYTYSISKEIENKFLIANQLMGAISQNELTIFYQPIVEMKQGNFLVGAEALIRWKNPDLGDISPEYFIPIAEKTGQIISIGKWVFRKVCCQLNKWNRKYKKIYPISVNISVKQLEHRDFASMMLEIINDYHIPQGYIELEITESVSSGDVKTIVKNLKEFKEQGLTISMDDFGTGYSSLGQLDVFELNKIKIDKIFIDDLLNVTKKQNLVKSIIAMAKSLELLIVAEGIENEDQLKYLRDLGCDLGQGYLFSKPLSIVEFEKYLIETNE